MKIFVSVVALLLHQVLGDVSTELVSRASNEFSNRLYKEVAKEPGNVLVCPISLHVALTVLHQGAGGSTARELENVLQFKSQDGNSIKESYKSALSGMQDNYLKIATKLFPAAGYSLVNDFVNNAQTYFFSGVQGVDYTKPQAAANTINKYVEEKTNNKIHDLISADSITPLTRLIIVNAVHFNANWKIPFPHAYEDDFKVTPTERVKTRMMTVTDYFHFKELPEIGAKVLRMDYEKGNYSMLIVLPNADDGLPAVENKLSHMSLTELTSGMRERKVEVTIPKFKLEQTIQLNNVLTNMGLTEMFSSRADLHKISSTENLFVSDVIQKTFINVHENGTEAAAATGFLEVLSAQNDRVIFYARRPFHVYLVHRKFVLFEGRFVGPFGQNFLEPIGSEEERIHFETSSEKDSKVGNPQGGINQNRRPTLPNKITGNRVTSRPDNSVYSLTNQAQNPSRPNSGYDNNDYDRFGNSQIQPSNPVQQRLPVYPTQPSGQYSQVFGYRNPPTSPTYYNSPFGQPDRAYYENERQRYLQNQ